MRDKGFALEETCLDKNVYVLNIAELGDKGIKLICTKGEGSSKAIEFLVEKLITDHQNDRSRQYGPIVITSNGKHKKLLAYYDTAVQSVFRQSISESLYLDPATMKTSWYGEVNAHQQKRILNDIISQLMSTPGISIYLTPHLMTKKGRSILADSARAASLAISLLLQVHRRASDKVIHTLGTACILQHLGPMLDDNDNFYPGKVYDTPNTKTILAMEKMGLIGKNVANSGFERFGVDMSEVADLVRFRGRPPKEGKGNNIALIYCISIANLMVSSYFTEESQVWENGEPVTGYNTSFGNIYRTMSRLDAAFGEAYFYYFNRDKFKTFIVNADRYYRLHTEHLLREGKYVSKVQKKALALEADIKDKKAERDAA